MKDKPRRHPFFDCPECGADLDDFVNEIFEETEDDVREHELQEEKGSAADKKKSD